MSEIWEAIQTNFVIILMVTARVSGIFTFNPIFSRNGKSKKVVVYIIQKDLNHYIPIIYKIITQLKK